MSREVFFDLDKNQKMEGSVIKLLELAKSLPYTTQNKHSVLY